MNGAVAFESKFMGVAINLDIASGLAIPIRLGTSSPKTSER
jgi:hypothetical protein